MTTPVFWRSSNGSPAASGSRSSSETTERTRWPVWLEVKPDAALVDLQMPGIGGIDVLRALRAADPDCQVILMTGNATLDTAIEAVKAGALDYLTKPFDFERLRGLLVTVREGIRRRERLLEVDADVARQFEFHGMVGRSPAMQELFDAIRRLAPHVRTVLITGETGTGKELVAKALHQLGPRQHRRLITVNCSAVVENAVRKRVVRPCARRVHRRHRHQGRPLRARRRRHALSRRGGRAAAVAAGRSCCGPSSTAKCSASARSRPEKPTST